MKNKYFLFFFFIVVASSCARFRPKPSVLYNRAQKNKPYDVIIVPGVPFNGIRWDTIMKGRVIWATYLFKNGVTKNIIFSGGAVYSPYIEGKVFALYAEALGVPKENIFIDSLAQHSTENVYYSDRLAKKLGFKKIAVATDPFQSSKLMGFTKRRIKDKIDFIPMVEDKMKSMSDLNPKIDASGIRQKDFKSIVETQSFFHRLKGTLGKNIKYTKD
jgi:hypothetical protein